MHVTTNSHRTNVHAIWHEIINVTFVLFLGGGLLIQVWVVTATGIHTCSCAQTFVFTWVSWLTLIQVWVVTATGIHTCSCAQTFVFTWVSWLTLIQVWVVTATGIHTCSCAQTFVFTWVSWQLTYPQSNIHAQRNTHKHMHTSNGQTGNCSYTCSEEGTHIQKHTHLLSI